MKNYFLPLLLIIVSFGYSQDNKNEEEVKQLKAVVQNAQTDQPMESVHVVNLNEVVGTITNEKENSIFLLRSMIPYLLLF